MTNPLRRFLGGLMLGALMTIPFVRVNGSSSFFHVVTDPTFIPLVPSEVIVGLGLLGLSFAWWGVRESAATFSFSERCSTIEQFRQRRRLRTNESRRHWLSRRSRVF